VVHFAFCDVNLDQQQFVVEFLDFARQFVQHVQRVLELSKQTMRASNLLSENFEIKLFGA